MNKHWPVHTSHIFAVQSNEAVINLSPSVLKWRETISALWPSKLKISYPVSTSHSLAVLSMEPVATSMPCGSNERQTISILCPLSVWYRCPVFASQILAFRSNDPVTILSLQQKYELRQNDYLPVGIVKGHGIHNVGVLVQGEQFLTGISVPYLACPIVWSCDEFVARLVECTICQWKQVSS